MVNFLIHNKYFSNIQWFILFIFLQTLNKTFLYCVETSAMFASTDDVVLNKHFNVLISHTQIVFLIALICECAKSMHLIVKEEINKIPLQNLTYFCSLRLKFHKYPRGKTHSNTIY